MLFGATDDDKPARDDDGIVKEATERWLACKDWQGKEDERTREDIKFANGDARNAWQWPERIYEARTGGGNDLPCLTINNTRVHNDLIINAMSKNRYGVKVRPVGGKASYKSAEMMETLIRRTQYLSKASSQFRKVAEQQVDGGIGYILIETAYVSEKSFDQDIYLKASRDPTAVYLDPWIQEPDGSDANFGFVFERLPRKEFNRKYPKYKDRVGKTPLDSMLSDWISDKEIMLVKYYRKKSKDDMLVSYKGDDGGDIEMLSSEIKEDAGKELFKALIADIRAGRIDGKTRPSTNNEVEWFMIAGDAIVERGKWAGKYIPICRCVGRELVIDATLDRKGHTRPLIDAQRMLNYNASTSVQVVALQPKTPWVGSARAFEGQESFKDANVNNYAVLMFNDIDEEAPLELQRIEPPQRLDPPKGSPAHLQGMQDAERQMMMISGQFQAQMGENDTQSAASGKAIGERQQQGDTATYHFPEHQGDMLRFIGVQLLDLYPKIYDTKRALHVIGEDGEKSWIQIDPDQQEAVRDLKQVKEDEEAITLAFNPSIGEYECVSDPGPDYATQRQEAWNAMSMILQQSKELAAVCADLLFKYGDFPGAEDISERLQKEIKATKPYLFDDAAEPQMLALQQQLQRLTALNAELMQKLALKELALKGKDEKRDVEASNAETNRLKVLVEALSKLGLPPAERARMEHELNLRTHDAALDMVAQSNQAALANNTGEDDSAPQPQQGGQGTTAAGGPGPRPIGPAVAATPDLMAQMSRPVRHPNGKLYAKHKGLGMHFEVGEPA